MGTARLIRSGVRVDGPVLGMSVRSGVKHGTAIRKGRFTCKMFVRFSVSIPTVVEGAIESPIQSCGGTVSEATAVTGLVVVEALRMSNLLCEAIEKSPYMMGVRGKENIIGILERLRPPVQLEHNCTNKTCLVNASLKRIGPRCTHRRVPRSRWVGAGGVDVDVARCSLKSFSPLRCLLRTRGRNRLSKQVDRINS